MMPASAPRGRRARSCAPAVDPTLDLDSGDEPRPHAARGGAGGPAPAREEAAVVPLAVVDERPDVGGGAGEDREVAGEAVAADDAELTEHVAAVADEGVAEARADDVQVEV